MPVTSRPPARLGALLAVCLAFAPAPAAAAPGAAAPAKKPAAAKPARRPAAEVAPLPPGEVAAVSHAPFESGDCSMCHARADAKDPGPVADASGTCLGCHDELKAILAREHKHPPAPECTTCHNPHNSRHAKLLRDEPVALCTSCHAQVKDELAKAKVKHLAVSTGAQCANCHNPHGSSSEKLLVATPFELCLGCHSKDGMRSADGAPMTNMKAWLDKNKEWHGPVSANDCSACHRPHGAESFRLLVAAYPAAFYAPFDAKAYALCFSCHEEAAFTTAETTTLTGFRNGSRNLHELHVNKGERGRTCRACHEVHASQQEHHLREGVPYGTRGWMLKLNYTKTAEGGACAKTCHATRAYDRRARTAGAAR